MLTWTTVEDMIDVYCRLRDCFISREPGWLKMIMIMILKENEAFFVKEFGFDSQSEIWDHTVIRP